VPVQIYLWSDLPEIAFQAKAAAAIMVRAQLDPAWRIPGPSVPSPGRSHGRRPVADRSRAVRCGDLTAKDMSVVSAPTLKTLHI
jgi:hypothetical protein